MIDKKSFVEFPRKRQYRKYCISYQIKSFNLEGLQQDLSNFETYIYFYILDRRATKHPLSDEGHL